METPLWLIMYHHVLPEQQDRFLSWVNQRFCPAVAQVECISSCMTKVLPSSVPDQDGSYTCVILMEPAFEKIDYSIPALLERAFGHDLGNEYTREWESTLATSHVDYVLVEGNPVEV